ncbi:hypothetical protein Pcinc_042515 [Petrolisthes cinctipes]|uniref:Cuticle protein 6 n=1 Tax=Petrolisthes cinctipes TaxID=88211 RepID=A0AAE1EFW9_PETCI|nr:hypothetical protein Pcinc_042515 [Petrolisthes cinctipes]
MVLQWSAGNNVYVCVSLQVVLSVAWCCSGQLVIPNPLRYYGAQEYRMEAPGQSSFAFYGLNQNRQETRLWDGTVVGQYSYIDANGKPAITHYDAGPLGFRVKANNLPIAPAAAPLKPVDYTPEVAEARALFMEKYNEAVKSSSSPSSSRQKRQIPYLAYPSLVNPMQPILPTMIDDSQTAATGVIPSSISPYLYANTFPSAFPMMPSNYPLYTTIKTEIIDKEPKDIESSRQRRDVEAVKPFQVPFPLSYAQPIPAIAKTTVKTHKLEAVDAASPADTTRLELVTKEREYTVPAVKYVQPSLAINPMLYSNPTGLMGSLYPFQNPLPNPFFQNPLMPIIQQN